MCTEISPKLRFAVRFALAAALCAIPCSAVAGDIALGEYLSAECVTCHQISGHATGGIPAIVGWPEATFIEALSAYKSGIRDNPVMRNITARLSDEEMAALAAYFAAQKRQSQREDDHADQQEAVSR